MKSTKLILNNFNIFLYIIPALFALSSIVVVNPPHIFDDLYRFYDFYGRFRNLSLQDFFKFLKPSSDYIITIYIFIFSKIGIPVNILLGIITYCTVFIILKVSFLILDDNKKTLRSYLFIIFAISVPALLSGVRNLHSIAFVYLAIYLFTKNKYIKGIGTYIFSLLIHFSSLFYLLLFALWSSGPKKIYIIWLISFIGFILPLIFLPYLNNEVRVHSTVPIIAKIEHYALTKDYYYTLTLKDSKIILATVLKFSWYPLLLAFLFYQYKKNTADIWFKVLLIISILMNFSFIFLTLFDRISLLAKIVFVVCLIKDEFISPKIKTGIFFFFLFLFAVQALTYIKGILNL
jgi:hypothetical protein